MKTLFHSDQIVAAYNYELTSNLFPNKVEKLPPPKKILIFSFTNGISTDRLHQVKKKTHLTNKTQNGWMVD